jgi:hypothetical protein
MIVMPVQQVNGLLNGVAVEKTGANGSFQMEVELGTEDIKPHKTGCPASIEIYSCPSIPLVGLIFVGQWIGSLCYRGCNCGLTNNVLISSLEWL